MLREESELVWVNGGALGGGGRYVWINLSHRTQSTWITKSREHKKEKWKRKNTISIYCVTIESWFFISISTLLFPCIHFSRLDMEEKKIVCFAHVLIIAFSPAPVCPESVKNLKHHSHIMQNVTSVEKGSCVWCVCLYGGIAAKASEWFWMSLAHVL